VALWYCRVKNLGSSLIFIPAADEASSDSESRVYSSGGSGTGTESS
jgi:hypothetical protein